MSIPARKLSGICEISTASFTVTNMPKVHEGENGAIEVSIRFLNNGQPYSLDAYIVEMYLLYQSQNIMTDAVELSVSSNTATGTMPEEFMTRSGCPLLVVRIKDPDSGQQVVAFHLPVHVENVLGQTVITTRPPTPSEVVYIGRSPYINESNHHWMVWDGETSQFKDSGIVAKGETGATGPQGPAGPAGSVTGIQIGGDTYEPDESGVVTLPEQEGGSGVPDGGTAGQILIKQSDADGDAIWKTPTAEDVGARSNTWTPSASDVGALPTNGTAADALKLGGVAAAEYLLANNAMSMELIYENLSSNSEFAEQPVTLSKPTTDFDLILYILRYAAGQNFFFGCFSTGAHPNSTLVITSWTIRRRDVSAGATPTVLEFGDCRNITTYGASGGSGAPVDNTLSIPYRIYGIKVGGEN